MLKFVMLLAGLIPPSSGIVLSQSGVQSEKRCNVRLDNAPTIRGLKLGQTVEQVKAALPTLLKRGSEATQDPGIGALESHVQVNAAEYMPGFAGINQVNVLFLDERLAQIKIVYDQSVRWQRESDFTSKVSESLNLPNAWEDSFGGSIMNCDGFFLRAEIGHCTSPTGLLIKLTNLTEEVDRRMKLRDEKQRGSFKP
jgi:hypothetical protein